MFAVNQSGVSISVSLSLDQSAVTWCLGRPTMEGKTARGASSPAKPALHRPDPLSHTRAVLSSSSHMTAGGAVGEQRRYDTESHCIWEGWGEGGYYWLLMMRNDEETAKGRKETLRGKSLSQESLVPTTGRLKKIKHQTG